MKCTLCSQAFDTTDAHRTFYKEFAPSIGDRTFELPLPTHCPDCRQQRRLAQANQMNLYERKCDLTGASIISNYHPSSPYKVYRQENWYDSAKWDPLSYGRDFDFSRSFFEQWQELSLEVPRPSMHRGYAYDENAEYTNYAGKNRDCYLIFDAEENRDCYYNYSLQHSEDCLECFRVRDSQLLYGCIDTIKSYNCAFIQDCDNCSDSMFLKNCIGCKHCLMCSNLRDKEYYVENKKVSKEEFETFRMKLASYSVLQQARKRFEKLKLEYPQKYMQGVQNENVLGNYLTNCKDATNCYDSFDLWDCTYVFQAFMQLKNAMDIQQCGDAETLYESCFSGYNAHSIYFCAHALGEPAETLYCTYSPHSKNLFGCVGVMHKQYCILNMQYTKEEYEELVSRIIKHMQETKEWGEFFPIELSTFAYNETVAMDYFPLTKEEVEKNGWRWLDEVEKKEQYFGPTIDLPDSIYDVQNDICEKILTCESSGKHFKIIPQELKLYRQMNLPLPHLCFSERHKDRMALRNPRNLWDRTCNKCKKGIKTSYAPKRPEKVYCEECFLACVQ